MAAILDRYSAHPAASDKTFDRRCPACESADTEQCLALGPVPALQNVASRSRSQARSAACGDIRLFVCRHCGHGFNASFAQDLVKYLPGYENNQAHSQQFARHVDEVADIAIRQLRSITPVVVEIGAGQGSFLRILRNRCANDAVRVIGFDPSCTDDFLAENITVHKRLFDQQALALLQGLSVDLVVMRHCIEHIHSPVELMAVLTECLSPGAQILIETPSFEWIVEHCAIHDIFYEHCNYWTEPSLRRFLQAAGFSGIEIARHFGGQYFVATGRFDGGEHRGLPTDRAAEGAARSVASAHAFGSAFESRLADLRSEMRGSAPAAFWGAGAKGVTLAGLLGADIGLDCLIDINPEKQGGFTASTAFPIVSPATAAARGVRRVVVLNPNYAAEVERMIDKEGLPFALEVLSHPRMPGI